MKKVLKMVLAIFGSFFRAAIVEGVNSANTSFWNNNQFVSSLEAYKLYIDLYLKHVLYLFYDLEVLD